MMMKEYGSGLISMDAHGTNHYDFKLVTILVLDDHGEGVPVAWMISNREDEISLKKFLVALQERTGPIIAKYDDAEQYYSSWNQIYGGNPKKLLCSWHVDRAWRVNIRNKVSDLQKQVQVYHHLRTLLELTDSQDFVKLLQQTVSWMLLDEDLKLF